MRPTFPVAFLVLALISTSLPLAAAEGEGEILCETYSDADIHTSSISSNRVVGPTGHGASAAMGEGDVIFGLETSPDDVLTFRAAGYGGATWRLVVAEGPEAGLVLAEGSLDVAPAVEELATVVANGDRLCFMAWLPAAQEVSSATYHFDIVRDYHPVVEVTPPPAEDPPGETCVVVSGQSGDTSLCTPPV